MQITSLMSREEHDPHDHAHDHNHEHIPVRLWQMVVGVIFIANSFLVEWAFEKGSMVAGLSAMVGAIILGWPIVATAVTDIKRSIVYRDTADGGKIRRDVSCIQANITAETLPVNIMAGEDVFAGPQNLTGVLEVRVTRAGEETKFGSVRELILRAEKTKLPIKPI